MRLAAKNDRLHEACALLLEELRIKDTRTSATVTSWMKSINEKGPDALLHLRKPVNIILLPLRTDAFH